MNIDSIETSSLNKMSLSDISIEQVDPFVDNTWDKEVSARDDHSVFHRSAWARVLVEAYGHRPCYLRFSVKGNDVSLLPLMEVKSYLTGCRGVSLPFSDFAGPLWNDATQATPVYQALVKFAYERKWKHLEIRGGSVGPAGATPSSIYGSHQVDLRQGIETIVGRLDSSVRRAIRKAEGSGLEVTIERSLKAMREFYELHSRTRQRHGLPPQPFVFFNAIIKHMIGGGLGEIVLAKLGKVPVAGAVFLSSGGRVIYKFGASITQYWPLRPNHLVMWNAIKYFANSGCREIHFGRTSQNDEGLSRFKQSWGSASETMSYFRRDWGTVNWVSASLPVSRGHPRIFGILPIAINRLAGRLIYPHLD